MPEDKVLDYEAVKETIPHRPPFLLIDGVKITEPGKKAVGYKSVSGNEFFFVGHFPQRAVMPGVLIVEALAQTGCVIILDKPEMKGKLGFFMGIEEVKFRKPVTPGDRLELHVEMIKERKGFGKCRGVAMVNGQVVTEGVFSFAVVDPQKTPES